jgi:short-subunit dehydrogenase
MLFGVDVIIIGPGAVATPIWSKAEEVDVSRYGNSPFAVPLEKVRTHMLGLGKSGLKPERLGDVIHLALTTEKPKVRYAITPNPFQDWMTRTLPKRTVDRIIGGRLGLLPKTPA